MPDPVMSRQARTAACAQRKMCQAAVVSTNSELKMPHKQVLSCLLTLLMAACGPLSEVEPATDTDFSAMFGSKSCADDGESGVGGKNEEADAPPANNAPCGACKRTDQKCLMCQGCERIFYCSKECQLVDWKTHKTVCDTKSNLVRTLLEYDKNITLPQSIKLARRTAQLTAD
jgi:hypothetical protein